MKPKQLQKKLKLENRIETLIKKKAFITFEDHKPNFINNPKCWLINPAKSNIGKVSKKLFDVINSEIRRKSGLLQWRNSSAIISWFKNFSNKKIYVNFLCLTSLISIHQYPKKYYYYHHHQKNYSPMLLILENNTPLLTPIHLMYYFSLQKVCSIWKE